MKNKAMALSGVVLIILLLGSLSQSTVFAKSVEHKADVVLSGTDVVVGEATLKIKGDKLTVKLDTTGLEPGHVFSVWGKVEGEDSFNLTGFSTDGKKSKKNGSGHFKATVKIDLDGPITFIVTLKDHGEPIKGKVDEQKSTKDFGCIDPNAPKKKKKKEKKNFVSCPSVQTATFSNIS